MGYGMEQRGDGKANGSPASHKGLDAADEEASLPASPIRRGSFLSSGFSFLGRAIMVELLCFF